MPKQIGELEEKILRVLALEVDAQKGLNTQEVQQILNHKTYMTIRNALKRMEEPLSVQCKEGLLTEKECEERSKKEKGYQRKGFVTYKNKKSQKNVPMQLYRLTSKGENQVLINEKFTTQELDRFIENYAENAATFRLLKAQHKAVGTELMTKILSGNAALGRIKQKGSYGQAQKMIVATIIADLKVGDPKKMDNFIDSFTKQNPRLKKKVRAYLKKRRLL